MYVRCEFLHLRSFFLFQGCVFPYVQSWFSLIIVTAVVSTCIVPEMRWMVIACCKSLCSSNQFPWNHIVCKRGSRCGKRRKRKRLRGRRRECPGRDEGSSWNWSIGRNASPEISFVMMLVCWMMWRQCCLSMTASERGTISNSRNPQAALIPGGRLMKNFHDDPGLGPLTAVNTNTWIVLTPDEDQYAEKFSDYSKLQCPPIGESETSEIDSVEFNRDWTLNDLSELTREKRNLCLCARSSMGLIYDRDQTMMCVLSGRPFNVSPVTHGGLVKRRIARKTVYVTTCSFEFTYTITRPDYSRWRFTWKESTTSTNVSRTVGSSDFCVRSFLGAHRNWPNWSIEIWICWHCQTMSWWVEYEIYLCQTATMSSCKGYLRVIWQRFCTESRTKCRLHLMISGMFVMEAFLWVETKVTTSPTCVISLPFTLRLMYMNTYFEKHDDLRWLTSWLRQNEINEHERKLDWNKTSHHPSPLDWNVRPTQFPMFDFNGNCCPTNISECRSLFCLGM